MADPSKSDLGSTSVEPQLPFTGDAPALAEKRSASVNRFTMIFRSWAVQIFAAAFFGVFCLGLWAYTRTGSISYAVDYLGGERLLFRPATFTFENAHVGQQRDLSVEVVNLTGTPVKFLGAFQSCTCITTETLPLVLAPGERRELSLKVQFPRVGDFTQRLVYWTDFHERSEIVVQLLGNVQP